jgi:sucrose phosphorylase
LAARTGEARESHRHRYTEPEVAEALRRPVVQATTEMIRLRATHPAFRGRFDLLDAPTGRARHGLERG